MYVYPMQELVQALQQNLDDLDPGIVGVAERAEGGTIIVLTRQGKPTPWGIWFDDSGTMVLVKVDSPTLSAGKQTFAKGDHLKLVAALKVQIDKGYI